MKSACRYCGREIYPATSLMGRTHPDQQATRDHLQSRWSPRRKHNEAWVKACRRCNELKAETPVEVFEFWLRHRNGRAINSKQYRVFCHELMVKGLEQLIDDEEAETGVLSNGSPKIIDAVVERAP